MSDAHGNTRGAWTGTLIIMLGALVICFGIVLGNEALWIGGIVLTVAGVVAWVVIEKVDRKKAEQHKTDHR